MTGIQTVQTGFQSLAPHLIVLRQRHDFFAEILQHFIAERQGVAFGFTPVGENLMEGGPARPSQKMGAGFEAGKVLPKNQFGLLEDILRIHLPGYQTVDEERQPAVVAGEQRDKFGAGIGIQGYSDPRPPGESFGQNKKSNSSSVWIYATLALVLVGAIAFSVYLANPSKQASPNENEITQLTGTQTTINSANYENVNSLPASNIHEGSDVNSTTVPTIDKKQVEKTVKRYISSQGGDITTRSVKVYYGDLDNDGDYDAAAAYESFTETGHYTFNLVIFRNNNGTFDFVNSEAVSGSGFYPPKSGGFRITGIKDNKIYAITSEDEEFKENIQKTQYVLKGNKLVESFEKPSFV